MTKLITDYSAGMVATVNEDGSPAVSPKATFVVLDEATIAFGNIRSPGTVKNLRRDPSVEVCFIDVVLRKAVRVKGKAVVERKGRIDEPTMSAFEASWAPYLPHMSDIVTIHLSAAEIILSPAYDVGFSEADLRETNLKKLNAL
ncbi:MAG: pyridoxamine 5'-phosphate oxidase family protein [Pseudomonadota bacterium]